jgi:O-antigen biosynthesis protein
MQEIHMPPPQTKEPGNELAFTGERFIPLQTDPLLALEHYHRYYFASRFARDRKVLDIGCGEGYGSAFLARHAGEVTGIDLDQATIDHAREKYASVSNLSFEAGKGEEIRKPDHSVDLAVSFELLEHLDSDIQSGFLRNVQRVLKPDGLFIVSSPERNEYAATYQAKNEFHKHEMTLPELKTFLSGYFEHVHLYAQRVLSYSTIWRLEAGRNESFRVHFRKELQEEVARDQPFAAPLYLIALCSNVPLHDDTGLESNSLFMDIANSDQTKHFARWALQLNSEVQKNRELIQHFQRQVEELGQRVEERTAWAKDLDNRIQTQSGLILTQQERILAQDKELDNRARWALSLESDVAKERAYAKECSQEIARIRREASSSLIYRVLAKLKLIPSVHGS